MLKFFPERPLFPNFFPIFGRWNPPGGVPPPKNLFDLTPSPPIQNLLSLDKYWGYGVEVSGFFRIFMPEKTMNIFPGRKVRWL